MVKRQVNVVLLMQFLGCIFFSLHQSQAQDILRQRQQSAPAQPQSSSNPLDSIQFPPQLASLTPQQLHQLANLRELQLQQQASQQQQQQQNDKSQLVAPAPIGADLLPTNQPQSSQNAPRNQQADNNDRHDDGAYNESGSEMEGVSQPDASGSSAAGAASSGSSGASSSSQTAPSFEVNWNKCPQLEPSESEKNRKTQVITKCLQSAPIPSNLTRENVETHREQIATCALKVEGWFDDQGSYRYDKAEQEIRAKKLEGAIEVQVLKFHVACKEEASKKFPRDQNKLIDQVQFYQACMDYYISIVCEIEVSVDQ